MSTDPNQVIKPTLLRHPAHERLAPDFWLDLAILVGGFALIVLGAALFMRAA